MEITIKKSEITFNKELNQLDELALGFSKILSSLKIKHAFISDYVAILFGRNRSSEDIDVICEKLTLKKFMRFWVMVNKNFECINASEPKNAYNEYLLKKTAIRFAYKGEIIPNVELKFVSNNMHKEAISSSIIVNLNNRNINIPALEQQIAFKLFLGSEKNIEDARFLFKLFEDDLKKIRLRKYIKELKIPIKVVKHYLGWSS